MVLQSLTYGTMVLGSRWSPGVAYWAIGTSPRKTSTSGRMHLGIGSWATANAVACGGRLLDGVDRLGRLRPLADADALAVAGAQLVEHDEVLAVGPAGAQPVEAERHGEDPAEAGQARVRAAQRHRADHLSDAHGRPA